MYDWKALLGATVLLTATSALGGCVMFRSHVKGQVAADETAIGSFATSMTICESGARSYFLGVDVASANQGVVMRIVQNPDPSKGPTIIMEHKTVPKEGLKLTRDNCSQLEVDVHPTNTKINGVRVMEGHAAFTCKLHSGGTARGRLTFSNCH